MNYQEHLFQHIQTGLLLFEENDEKWSCQAANPAAMQLLNRGEEHLTGTSIEAIFSKGIQTRFSAEGPELEYYDATLEKWFLLFYSTQMPYITVSFCDITAQKESAISGARLLKLYKTLSSSLADNEIILLDQDYNIIFSEGNPRFIRVQSEESFLGKKFADVVSAGPFSFILDYIKDIFSSEGRELENEIDGNIYRVSLYTHAPDSKTAGESIAVLLLKDVTETSKKQRELDLAYEQLNRSNKELEEFAYAASHDLQAPLRKIQSYSKLLMDKYDKLLTGSGSTYLNRMAESARHMEALMADLLTYSKATSEKSQFEKKSLVHLLSEVVSGMGTDNRLNLQINASDDLPEIDMIPIQIYRLYQNLIENSLKFTKPDTPPALSISMELRPESVSHQTGKTYGCQTCLIQFVDNGIGFEQENAERIFQIFQRLHGKSSYEGAGVGLAISKKIVENHRGEIFAESTPGEGATFSIILPIQQT